MAVGSQLSALALDGAGQELGKGRRVAPGAQVLCPGETLVHARLCARPVGEAGPRSRNSQHGNRRGTVIGGVCPGLRGEGTHLLRGEFSPTAANSKKRMRNNTEKPQKEVSRTMLSRPFFTSKKTKLCWFWIRVKARATPQGTPETGMSRTLGAEGHGGGNPGAALSAKTKGARAAAVKPSLYSWTNLDLTVAPPSCPQRPPSHVFLLDQLGQKRSPTPALGAQNQQRGSPRPTPPAQTSTQRRRSRWVRVARRAATNLERAVFSQKWSPMERKRPNIRLPHNRG